MVEHEAADWNRELEDHMATVESICDELDEMHRQASASLRRRRALRRERRPVERRLDEALAMVGELVMDWQNSGGSVELVPPFQEEEPKSEEVERASPGPEETSQTSETSETRETRVTAPAEAPEVSEDQCAIVSRPEEGISASLGSSGRPRKMRQSELYGKSQADTKKWKIIGEIAPEIKRELGSSPPAVDSFATAKGELDLLCRLTSVEELEKWKLLPGEFQFLLVATIVARLRRVQEEGPGDMANKARQGRGRKMCGRLRDVVTNRSLEYVHGLNLDHKPKEGSWRQDARAWEEKLRGWITDNLGQDREVPEETPEEMLGELQNFIEGSWEDEELVSLVALKLEAGLDDDDPRLVKLLDRALESEEVLEGSIFRSLRKAIRQRRDGDDEAERKPVIPEDWPYRDRFEGATVLMVGGDRRPGIERHIQRELKPGDFEWIAVERDKNGRRVASAADRIKRGSIDVVLLVTKLLSHSHSNKITGAVGKAPDVPGVALIYLNDSYGLDSIRREAEAILGT